ncbi:nitrous oxide reductase accessory protein NosL [Flavisolibacter sp. BT320]|nr:nitrous oxide reductase accessory protein NosL [Flavisolibacter longurius]
MKKMSTISRILIAVASAGMIAVFFLPVWAIYLIAPQYPEGLQMNIWLTKFSGQVDIINGLNHYIGMKHISADMFPEFGYMKYILAGFIAYGLLVAFVGTRKLLLSLLVLTAILAGAALYDFYQWGYDYGHDLDPNAAIKVPGFSYQPPVIGHKTLLNFDAYSYPDTGGWIITVAGAIFFLVYFYEWYKNRKNVQASPVAKTKSASKIAVAIATVMLATSCNTQPEPFVVGKDLCADCMMTIMEPQFGAEIITKKGRIYKFDDLHCITNYINKKKISQDEIGQALAVDYNDASRFIPVEEAAFVTSAQLKSPMNSNTAAFAGKEAASKAAGQTGGTVKDWKTVLTP